MLDSHKNIHVDDDNIQRTQLFFNLKDLLARTAVESDTYLFEGITCYLLWLVEFTGMFSTQI